MKTKKWTMLLAIILNCLLYAESSSKLNSIKPPNWWLFDQKPEVVFPLKKINEFKVQHFDDIIPPISRYHNNKIDLELENYQMLPNSFVPAPITEKIPSLKVKKNKIQQVDTSMTEPEQVLAVRNFLQTSTAKGGFIVLGDRHNDAENSDSAGSYKKEDQKKDNQTSDDDDIREVQNELIGNINVKKSDNTYFNLLKSYFNKVLENDLASIKKETTSESPLESNKHTEKRKLDSYVILPENSENNYNNNVIHNNGDSTLKLFKNNLKSTNPKFDWLENGDQNFFARLYRDIIRDVCPEINKKKSLQTRDGKARNGRVAALLKIAIIRDGKFDPTKDDTTNLQDQKASGIDSIPDLFKETDNDNDIKQLIAGAINQKVRVKRNLNLANAMAMDTKVDANKEWRNSRLMKEKISSAQQFLEYLKKAQRRANNESILPNISNKYDSRRLKNRFSPLNTYQKFSDVDDQNKNEYERIHKRIFKREEEEEEEEVEEEIFNKKAIAELEKLEPEKADALLNSIPQEHVNPERKYGEKCCSNKGKCYINEEELEMCKCPSNFTGRFCETDVDECKGNPCGEHELCHNLYGGYRCFCKEGFVKDGDDCVPVITCDESPCLNAGSCLELENGKVRCICRLGFLGRRCQRKVMECEDATCAVNEICVSTLEGFECLAPPRIEEAR